MNLPLQLYSAEQVRALDHCAINEFNVPGIELMERAGAALFNAIRQEWPSRRRIAVFCGAGNNGGDGFVVARFAKQAGLEVDVYLLTDVSRLKGDARLAYEKMTQVVQVSGDTPDEFNSGVEIIVDALLGTGLSGNVEGRYKETIEWINQLKFNTGCKIAAADIPSGLQADTGCILGEAVQADLTVTFIGLKQGLLTADGPDCCGRLSFDDLNVDAQVYDRVVSSSQRLTDDMIHHFFPPRKRNSNKGRYGHVLVIGGNYGMAGAVRLAGEAALRSGAGRVSVACRPEHVSAVVASRPELMCHGLPSETKPLVSKLKTLIEGADCLVVGPGLGQDEWAREIISVVREAKSPVVIDADALNLLAKDNDKVCRDKWVYTPHPGEAARLLGITPKLVQADRFTAVEQLQSQLGGTVVLKGNGTLVRGTAGETALCDAGNPGMASAGMGDVLSGIIAASITQSGELERSAKVAALLHARAGDLVAKTSGERGLIASDLFPHINRLVNPE